MKSDTNTPTRNLKPAAFHILLALMEDEQHGYGIMQTVEEHSNGRTRLSTGPFYRHLRRLMDMGLVEETPDRPTDTDPRRGAYYRITKAGRTVLADESTHLAELVKLTRRLGTDAGSSGS